MANRKEALKNAAVKLKEITRKSMDTMFEKQSKTKALKRLEIVTKDVGVKTENRLHQYPLDKLSRRNLHRRLRKACGDSRLEVLHPLSYWEMKLKFESSD